MEQVSVNNCGTGNVERIAALCGIIWFACTIDACYTWFFPWEIRSTVGFLFVFYATILLYNRGSLVFDRHRIRLVWLLLALVFLMVIIKMDFLSPMIYLPLACLAFWNRQILLRLYDYFKRFIVFYAILSIVVEIFVVTGVWTIFPHIDLPPQDFVQINHDTINHFYGLFVIPDDSLPITFWRAMGPLREGGHFSLFLGFAYFVEKVVFHKRNIWLLICGFLTLSPNFLFFLLVTEGYYAIKYRQIYKFTFFVFLLVVFLGVVFLYSPQFIQDEIVRVILERSLEENLNDAESDGFMALLEGRTNNLGQQMFNDFMKSENMFTKLFGLDKIRDGFVLSDYRILLYRFGYIGFSIYVLCTAMIAYSVKGKFFCSCLFLLALYVMISRAWMFDQAYIWAMMLLAANAKYVNDLYATGDSIKTLDLNVRVVEEENH